MPSNGTSSTSSSSGRKSSSSSRGKHEGEVNPDLSLQGIGNYAFEKTIGQGNFAKVKLAKHKLTGQEVAIKIIDKTTLDEKKLGKLHREVRIMKMLNHPNIVKLFEVIETKHTLFLVMEYVNGGELYDYLVAHGRMKEKDARVKFRQILSAVNYCHQKRVIHRDLKAENLLLDANLNIKIADFGFSNNYQPDGQLDTFCGSPPYAAPELFQGRKYVGPEVDVWSLGVILYVLCTGCLPFDGKDLKEMREVVCRGRYKVPFYLSDTCEKLLRKFLVRDPTKRSTLDVVSDDAWINDGFDDSPVTKNIQPDISLAPDEEIIRMMCDKFNLSPEMILGSLQANAYDDIGAIYMLLHDQKQSGKWTPYSNPNQLSPMSPIQLQQGTATPISRAPLMQAIGEDDDAMDISRDSYSSTPGQQPIVERRERAQSASAQGGRQRPVTWVGNESQVQKLMEDMGKQNLQNNPGSGPKIDNVPLPAGHAMTTIMVSGAVNIGQSNMDTSAGVNGSTNVNAQVRPQSAQAQRTANGDGDAMDEDHANHLQNGQSANSSFNAANGANNAQANAKQGGRGVIGAIRSIGHRFSEASQQNPVQVPVQQLQEDDKPRVLRFTFNSNTTSSKAPEDIVREIIGACQKNNIKCSQVGKFLVECAWNFRESPFNKIEQPVGNMDVERLQKALDEVMNTSQSTLPQQQQQQFNSLKISDKDMKDTVRFDVEVCELPRLKNLHGLRFRRIAGGSDQYKDACGRLLATVNL
ncbi:hypothetical protein MIR68_003102 [Amoeboaphelidium protococcarum]|nr:hypothetical protein MIR68_003102 [Amoeboaphelidium protococcarum]